MTAQARPDLRNGATLTLETTLDRNSAAWGLALLDALTDYLPEALPFSSYSTDKQDDKAFSRETRDDFLEDLQRENISWEPTPPLMAVTLVTMWREEIRRFSRFGIGVRGEAFLDERLRRALLDALGRCGDALGAFYGSIVAASHDFKTNESYWGDGWMGIVPALPLVAEWFGGDYRPLLHDYAHQNGTATGQGLRMDYDGVVQRHLAIPGSLFLEREAPGKATRKAACIPPSLR